MPDDSTSSGDKPELKDAEPTQRPAWFRAFFGLNPRPTEARQASDRRVQPTGAAAGVELAGGICLFAGIGYGLDYWLDSLPWCTVTGTLLGFVAGMYLLIKSLTR
ncbi:MAG: AtpZ/AtpI family protein [Planctomycetota bacterium]